jgi:hypothetical protein
MAKKEFYKYDDIKKLIDVKDGTAYSIIRKLNKELANKGYMTQRGRVNARYFHERYNIGY